LTEAEPQDLFGPAASDLVTVEANLRKDIEKDPPEVGRPMADLFAAGGKRVRPALVLLAGMCGRYDAARLMPAAMAVELTHAATLVHDDVIDRSPVRRGRPTVAAKLGDEPAIVVGDFYFAKAYEHAARTQSPEVVAILAHTVMRICAGEVRQQEVRYRYSTDVNEYMQRIDAKTATLLAACCDIGALLGGLSDKERSALRAYGRELGLAFQIADDVLDYTSSEGEIGKPIGHDVAEGFATLPLMLAKEDVSVRDRLRGLLEDDQPLDAASADEVIELVRSSDGPRRALEQARNHSSGAREKLEVLESTAATAALASLADYVASRKL
jgi:heptaprenyl diphosphate synthase component 2